MLVFGSEGPHVSSAEDNINVDVEFQSLSSVHGVVWSSVTLQYCIETSKCIKKYFCCLMFSRFSFVGTKQTHC